MHYQALDDGLFARVSPRQPLRLCEVPPVWMVLEGAGLREWPGARPRHTTLAARRSVTVLKGLVAPGAAFGYERAPYRTDVSNRPPSR